MIKKLLTSILIILSFNMISCSKISYIINKKPSNDYYTQCLYKDINEYNFNISILDTNVYAEITVDKEDNRILNDMISSLTPESYLTEIPTNLPNKPLYNIYIKSDKNKFVIEVYGDNIISIYPWDGNYSKDYISLSNVPIAFKLEQFCKYAFEKD
ncbi:MAG: DUF4883 family protein [Sarcina sp.]